jgi:hypothetical protein
MAAISSHFLFVESACRILKIVPPQEGVMSNVKIKKSVLQSIIKKSLSESGLHSDPSRRLVVGPDTSSLPAMLPLTPSDRMSTQLEVERPPVEDPEYVPMNSKELGLALQALAEMIPTESVSKAYYDFQDTIERIQDEGQEDDELDHMGGSPDGEDDDMSVESQLESIRRKNRRFDALLREAPKSKLRGQGGSSKRNEDPEALAALERMKDYKPKVVDQDPKTRKEQMQAFGRWLARNNKTLASTDEKRREQFKSFLSAEGDREPGREAAAATMRDRDDEPDDGTDDLSQVEKFKPTLSRSAAQILADYPEVCNKLGINRAIIDLLANLVYGGSITKDELEKFLVTIETSFMDDKAMKKSFIAACIAGSRDASILAEFIRKFSDEKEPPKAGDDDKFTWRGQFKRFGYAAESGIRQAFIKDVEALFKLKQIVFPEADENEIESTTSEAFETALTTPDNKEFLNALFDEEGLQEYLDAIENPENYEASDLYRNFRGIIGYEVMSKIAELRFKPYGGKPGRLIAKAFISPQLPNPPGSEEAKTDGPPTRNELDQLESIATSGTFKEFFDEFVEEAAENDYRNILTGAAILTGEDLDVEEYGNYIQPAFASLKKLTSGKKTPDVALKQYTDDESPEGQEYIKAVKAANVAAGKRAANKPVRK